MRTQGFGALAPQPVGPSGQLGKSKLSLMQSIFFLGMELDSVNQTARHAGTCSVGVELLKYVQEQDGGTTETVSEAPGAYGLLRRQSRRWGCSI